MRRHLRRFAAGFWLLRWSAAWIAALFVPIAILEPIVGPAAIAWFFVWDMALLAYCLGALREIVSS